jgi:hypothetical protein
MRRYPVADKHKVDCGTCYGNGCSGCDNRGWIESSEGREEREDAEERRADAIRKGEW